MDRCPPLPSLEGLLNDSLAESERAALVAHIESCSDCQESLDRLSAPEHPIDFRRPLESQNAETVNLTAEFLGRMEALPSSVATPHDQVGEQSPAISSHPPIGYEIVDVLGRGGSGVVYKAVQLRLKRTVALKMLLAGSHASENDRTRFLAEAEAVARLQSPNIVQIFEVGEQEGCPFLALEYVEGQSLADYLEGAPQPHQTSARFCETLARAIRLAHERGIVHRDLKPANILLGAIEPAPLQARQVPLDEYIPKITDFGLAKRVDSAGQTQTGQILGTPAYMAPEQARGQNKHVGPKADIYALGSILYHLLTGRAPFQGVTPVETILQVLHTEPVTPRRLQPGTPRDLEIICLKCLEKEPAKRYASALDLADDLERYRVGKAIRARSVGPVEQGWRWCRRNPGMAGALSALALLFVLGFAGVTWGYVNAERARQVEASKREQAEALLYGNSLVLAEREWSANNVSRAEYWLDQCRPAADQSDRRGWEWNYLKGLCHLELVTRQAHSYPIYGLAYSRDGKYLATAAGDPGYNKDPREIPGEVTLWDAETLEPRGHFMGHSGTVFDVSFSEDGRQLYTLSADRTARIWDTAGRKEHARFPAETRPFWRGVTLGIGPEGRFLIVPYGNGIRLLDAKTQEVIGNLTAKSSERGCLALSHDKKRLAVAGDRLVQVWDLTSRKPLYEVTGDASAVAFSPGDRFLATIDDQTVLIHDADSGRERLILRGHGGGVRALSWSPDGLSLASAGVDQTVRVWDVRNGQEQRIYRGHGDAVFRVVYSPDGSRIASADQSGVLKVWEATRDRKVLELGPVPNTTSLAFAADGTRIVAAWPNGDLDPAGGVAGWDLPQGHKTVGQRIRVAKRTEWPLQYVNLSHDGRLFAAAGEVDPTVVRVWETDTGQEFAALPGHTGRVRTLAFSPNRGQLAVACGDRRNDTPRDLFIWRFPEVGQTPDAPIAITPPTPIQCLAYSADGSQIIAGERGTLREGSTWKDGFLSVWDAHSGRLVRRWLAHPGTVQTVAVDSSGSRVVSGGRSADQSVRVWNLTDGRLLHDLRGPIQITSVTFSPDGKRIAAVGYEGIIYLWDTATGQALLTLRGPLIQLPNGVACDGQVLFSPDGTRLAANCWNGTVYVWEANSQP